MKLIYCILTLALIVLLACSPLDNTDPYSKCNKNNTSKRYIKLKLNQILLTSRTRNTVKQKIILILEYIE